MKDRTSKQCSFKRIALFFLIRMHFFVSAISCLWGSGSGLGGLLYFFVFMGMKTQAPPARRGDANNHLSLEVLKT